MLNVLKETTCYKNSKCLVQGENQEHSFLRSQLASEMNTRVATP